MDYLNIAATEARRSATRLAAQTHWNTYDAPMHRDRQEAACGSYVDRSRFSATPTCVACLQQQAIYNARQF